MIKAVFFDIDDTLYDTSGFAKLARKAALQAMIDAGLPLSQQEAYLLLREIIKEKGSNYDKHFNILTKRVMGDENPLLIAVGMITYHNVKFALLRLFPDTMSTLIYLKKKDYQMGVISNGLTIKQWEKLIRLGLYHFFDEVVTSQEAGSEKPDSEIFQLALERMGCKAEESVMVGNKFSEDILGATEVGMSAILVNSELTENEKEIIEIEGLKVDVISDIGQVNTIL
ncbi:MULTISPECIES: TIGR02253 family HAD-type hydrolase [Methanobacterium]|jgi:putative hydrolase of the HAD superfamily|uniref:Glyceraldehyde 3-phosphate phosphatase n=1 Tax=Methanobacterium subterraneum TaxID=59277 RepID=A0A2H4VMP9_9EURY|nr:MULTISPECIES: TIGR02253 family HAD-type hydrolase [Methanobacterium]MBW4257060.1 TIGR02253 family HAD-type hydrolase [Methanobacterium sp. YSL]PKL73415.1 MAG: haloacid dehalogenase [Methanobacteriales archaeon HGW-Methanobacteriales-2]AUB58393.1 haloacid dehalogenase [Methanobacterium sp. MZ-A1]AUB59368.1 haloacid dehalogenase [Methanobacterium subterraneum]NMO08934.1 TIGR02253 family HAD-type hydrolase [Methanobacterium subterraneum]